MRNFTDGCWKMKRIQIPLEYAGYSAVSQKQVLEQGRFLSNVAICVQKFEPHESSFIDKGEVVVSVQ